MADFPVQFDSIPFRRVFPWLHLLRAFWIAVDIRKLILASAALILLSGGSLVIEQLPFGRPQSDAQSDMQEGARWPWQSSLGYEEGRGGGAPAELRRALADPQNTLGRIASNWKIALRPVRITLEPALEVFRGNATWPELANAVTRVTWSLLVWALFGGAIARMSAMQFARDQHVGIRSSLAFVGSRFPGYLSAPMLPLLGVAIFWGLCVLGGWLGRIPNVGGVVLGVLWGLELVFGLMMAIVLIGVAAGWPLMFAAISVEGTDGFDGLSRTYNYVFERPLYYLWQVVVMAIYGSVVIFFVWFVAQLAVALTVWGVSWGLGYDDTYNLVADSPALVLQGIPPDSFVEPEKAAESSVGAGIAQAWMAALATFVMGFVYSFFWTSATIIYFVLRRSVDANDFDEIYVDDTSDHDDLLPLVGASAMGTPQTIAGSAAVTGAPTAPPEPPPVDLTP